MKTKFFSVRNVIMGISAVALSTLFVSCKDDEETPVNNNPYTISGNASGAQVVPPVSESGTGSINGTLTPTTRTLIFTTSWSGLTGAPVSGGFYNGDSAVNGTLTGPAWVFDSTAATSGSITDTLTLTTDQVTQLLTGKWYYQYNTVPNPSGEIRGQITATR